MRLKTLAAAVVASLGETAHRYLTRYMTGTGMMLQIRSPVEEVKELIEEGFERVDARVKALERDFQDIEKKAGRPRAADTGGSKGFDERLTPEQEEHRKAFARFLRKGDDSDLADIQRKAMNTGSDPDGGFLVIPEMDATIDRVAETVSAMYRLADTRTIGTAKWEKMVKTSGMAMRRVADGATGGESTEPRFSKVSIEVHTAEAEPWVHNETLEDAFINLEEDLANEAAVAFAEGGGLEFISGDGVGCARGFLTYPIVANAAYEWGKIGYIVSGASGAFKTASTSVNSADALVDLQHALKPRFRQGASWLMNDATAGVVRKLKDADGRHIWTESLVKGQPALLLGHPVEIDDNMPDIGAGAYAIAFGNWKAGYKIINRSGTVLIRDPYTTKGQTKFNFRRRFGGGVSHFEALKLLKFATS